MYDFSSCFDFAGRGGAGSGGDLSWSKWGFWLLHSLLFLLVYAGVAVLPLTQWRVRTESCITAPQYLCLSPTEQGSK